MKERRRIRRRIGWIDRRRIGWIGEERRGEDRMDRREGEVRRIRSKGGRGRDRIG